MMMMRAALPYNSCFEQSVFVASFQCTCSEGCSFAFCELVKPKEKRRIVLCVI